MDPLTITTYNKLAHDYDQETIDFWERFPHTILDTFTQKTTGSVLDLGSGPGRDGLLLQARGLSVTCIDASETMVRLCAERGLKAIQGDFLALPFPNTTFQGVWAYTSLLHIPKKDLSKALDEIHRVLAPQGIFGLGMIEGDFEGYRESSGVNLPRWFTFYTKAELEQALVHHGFEIIYFEQFKPGSKNYLNFIARKVS